MFLDIAVGILLAIFGNWYFKIDITVSFILICVLFALSPDIDVIFYIVKNKGKLDQMSHAHRDILHHPLIFIPLGVLILWPFSKTFSLLFAIAALLHFFHDSVGIGWGVKWFCPFSKKSYKFLSEKDGKLSRRFVTYWDENELIETAKKTRRPALD